MAGSRAHMGKHCIFRQRPNRRAVSKQSGLRIAGSRELLGRALEAEPAQVSAERGIDLAKNGACCGKSFREVLPHPRFLRALSGKEQYDVHWLESNDHRGPGESGAK